MVMLDRGNLQEVGFLYDEYNALTQAIENIDSGGRITGMTISSGVDASAVGVSTAFMAYPQPMIDSVKSQLQGQRQAIRTHLTELGVNMDAPGWHGGA